MMCKTSFLVLSAFLAVTNVDAFFFGRETKYDKMFDHWSDLRVKIPSFYSLPRTTPDALSENWVKVDDCSTSLEFRGNRYVKDNDRTIMLLFTNEGRLAGMQIGIPKDQAQTGQLGRAFIEERTTYTVTAYFVEPEQICTSKRDTFSDMLKFQLGPYSAGNFVTAPMNEADVTTDVYPWVTGKCFWLMGMHYWSKTPTRASCDDSNPFFLLYNRGKLNAFGWTFYGNMESSYFERPGTSDAARTMVSVPRCFYSDRLQGRLRTMHVYFDSPYNNFC